MIPSADEDAVTWKRLLVELDDAADHDRGPHQDPAPAFRLVGRPATKPVESGCVAVDPSTSLPIAVFPRTNRGAAAGDDLLTLWGAPSAFLALATGAEGRASALTTISFTGRAEGVPETLLAGLSLTTRSIAERMPVIAGADVTTYVRLSGDFFGPVSFAIEMVNGQVRLAGRNTDLSDAVTIDAPMGAYLTWLAGDMSAREFLLASKAQGSLPQMSVLGGLIELPSTDEALGDSRRLAEVLRALHRWCPSTRRVPS